MKFNISPWRLKIISLFAYLLIAPFIVYTAIAFPHIAPANFFLQTGELFFHLLFFSLFVLLGSKPLLSVILTPWCVIVGFLNLVELYLYFNFSTFFNWDCLMLIINSNATEAAGFLANFFNVRVLLLFFMYPLAGICFLLVPKRFVLYAASCFLICITVWGLTYSPQTTLYPESCMQRLDYWLLAFINNSRKIDFDKINQNIHAENKEKDAVYVLVIGESHSRRHSSIYGYSRKNMPLLMQRLSEDGFFRFNDVVSPHSLTMPVLKKLLTMESHGSSCKYSNSHNIIDIFKKAGFKTWYLTNQPSPTEKNSYFEVAYRADCFRFESDGINVRDEKFVDSLIGILADVAPKKFIILHLAGSHWPYKSKYPPEFQKFQLNEKLESYNRMQKMHCDLLNTYDNSLLYVDFVLNKLMNIMQKSVKNGFLLYLSDHGEALYENNLNCGHTDFIPLPQTVEIPMFLLLTREYMKRMPSEQKARIKTAVDLPWCSEDLPFLLIDLARINYRNFDATRSLTNPAYVPQQRIVSPQGISYEQLKKSSADVY